MNPESSYTSPLGPPTGSGQPKLRLALIVAGAVVALVVIVIIALLSHKSTGPQTGSTPSNTPASAFSIQQTNPSSKDVTNQTTSLAVTFSQPLANGSATVTSTPRVVTTTTIAGNVLTINLAPHTLKKSNAYTITIVHIKDTQGHQLSNQTISFTPTYTPADFVSEDALTNIGFSAGQISLFNAYIGSFDPWATQVTIDGSSIEHHHDPNTISPWQISFNIDIDGTGYKAITTFADTGHLQLTIDDANGKVLYTAGNPGSLN